MSFYLMHRGWRDHHLFKDQPYSDGEAWEYLIAAANYSPTKYRQAHKLYDIPRGDIATSYRSLAEKWKWSTNKVIRFLKLLQCDKMISIKTTSKTEQNFLQISVINYEVYQNPNPEKETPTEHRRNTDGTPTDTASNTNVKKINKINKNKKSIYTSDFETFWKEYPPNNGPKKNAFKAYCRAIDSGEVSQETLLDGARRYGKFCADSAREISFILHAATWLNQAGWETHYLAKDADKHQEIAPIEERVKEYAARRAAGKFVGNNALAVLEKYEFEHGAIG